MVYYLARWRHLCRGGLGVCGSHARHRKRPRVPCLLEYVYKDGNGRPQGEEPCDVTSVQMFRQGARRDKALFELWKKM